MGHNWKISWVIVVANEQGISRITCSVTIPIMKRLNPDLSLLPKTSKLCPFPLTVCNIISCTYLCFTSTLKFMPPRSNSFKNRSLWDSCRNNNSAFSFVISTYMRGKILVKGLYTFSILKVSPKFLVSKSPILKERHEGSEKFTRQRIL